MHDCSKILFYDFYDFSVWPKLSVKFEKYQLNIGYYWLNMSQFFREGDKDKKIAWNIYYEKLLNTKSAQDKNNAIVIYFLKV